MLSQKKKITVRISRKMKLEIEKNIQLYGYGKRGKSRWLSDAIVRFGNLNNIVSLIEEGQEINQAKLSLVEAFYLNDEYNEKLIQLMIRARENLPLLKGVQSVIIRACIIAKLARI